MLTAAEPWIRIRLERRGVFKEGTQWKADLHGQVVGSFATQAQALKAYRKAAFDKFGEQALLPTEADIDAALAHGEIASPGAAPPQAPVQPTREPPKPQPKPPPKQASKPTHKPTSHKR